MQIQELMKREKIYLAAHRGVCGGNIPCNSLQAFRAALNQGVSIMELDVSASADGELFVQHPGMEHLHLRMRDTITRFPASAVENFYLSNADLTRTEWSIPRLEETLLLLRDRCIINIDKFWDNPESIAKLVRKLGMENQVIIKTDTNPRAIDAVEKYAPDLPYMVLVSEEDTVTEMLESRNINYIGTEVIFKTEDAPVASREYIDHMHQKGKLVWVNALVYDYRAVLSGGHNDDISMIESPDLGWGWLAERGFDIIQTDFLLACQQYLRGAGYNAD